MSGPLCKVSSSRVAGGTGANARYILRDKACDRWETHHVPEHARLGWTEPEQKRAVADHLDRQAERGRGERRNYRVVLSFERPVDSDKALALAREFLDQTPFRDNPALLAVHRNTEHVHVHILLTARKTDGYKLDLDRRDYESFNKTWARIYEREMNRDAGREQAASRHREAVQDRTLSLAEWRRRYGQLRREGLSPAEVRQIIGERPTGRSASLAATHIRRDEHEKGRIAERLQAAGATLGRSQATLGKEAEHAGPAPRRHDRTGPADRGAGRGTDLARRGERAADGPLRGVAGLAGRAGAAVRDHDRAAERGLAHFLRDLGGGVEREVDRIVRTLADARGGQGRLVQQVERQLVRLEQQRESSCERVVDRSGGLRADCARVRGRLDARLGENAGRLTFKENVYPLLRTLEKYLDRLSDRFEPLREDLARLKEHLWERYTGHTGTFREELELKRHADPDITFQRDFDLSRELEKVQGETPQISRER